MVGCFMLGANCMSDKLLGGWGVKWLRMWTREWVDRETGLRTPAARIWKSWFYGRWPSRWSPGRGGIGEPRMAFFLFVVTDHDGRIAAQGSVQLLSRAKKICNRELKMLEKC